ncbi:MBL fold metallo-hydrolase [Rhodococcus qingshengii]|uniref:MBL fold metallo-hydrolase n=1 Tax=Rhodococcus qingshengii TaxID=334542 RepID=UPI0036D84AB8
MHARAFPDNQPPARIDDRIAHIPLPLPVDGLPIINCFAVIGDDGITLIDPGFDDERSEAALDAALNRLGAGRADVSRILVTHAHRDHYGLALEWKKTYGTEVLLGREERHTVTSSPGEGGAYPYQALMLRMSGAPALADKIEALGHEGDPVSVFGPPTDWISNGDVIDCGGYEITAVATPGHTRGHTVFIGGDDVMFSGDHILPRTTPTIGFEYAPEDSPLTSYLRSLQDVIKGPRLRMLPAHGHTDGEVVGRSIALVEHHDQRLGAIRDHVAAGAHTACVVATRMSWTRRNVSLDSLEPLHASMAVLEIRAHLDHLVGTGELARHTTNHEVYTLA